MSGSKDLSKEVVYQNLRSELNDTFKRQDTYYLAAFTITVSIWAFAIESKNAWIAMLPLIILIPISLRVRNLRYSTTFISAFIAVYLENGLEYGWESLRETYYDKNKPTFSKKISEYFSRISFSFLSFASSAIFWFMYNGNFKLWGNYWIGIFVLAVQLLIIFGQAFIWRKYAQTSYIKKPLIENWQKIYYEMTSDEDEKISTL